MKRSIRQRTARRERGVFLVEMLVYLVILAAVALIAGDLLILLMHTMRDTAQRDTMIARVDSALDQLRRDAWGAQAFRPRGQSTEIDLPEGTVTWNNGPKGLTRLEKGRPARTWVGMPRVEFRPQAGNASVLVVAVDSGPGGAARREEIALASERLLAGGVR